MRERETEREYLAAPGLIFLVLSGDLLCSVHQAFQFNVVGSVGHKCTADIPLRLLNHRK